MSGESAVHPTSHWGRRLRRAAVIGTAVVALYATLGFFAVPPLLKAKLETLLTDEFGRAVSIGKVEFNPFTLKATLHDCVVADREAGRTLFAFDALEVNGSLASLWYRAPVFDALRLTRPRITFVRAANGSYNIEDLVERWAAAPPGPTPRFSLNNIEIDGGEIAFDDRVRGRVDLVTKLGLALPFLSSLPHDAQVHVTPRFSGGFNGTPFALAANTTTPFADTEEASLDIDLDALPLPRYVDYLPLRLSAKLVGGALTTRLKVVFVTEKRAPRTLTVAGDVRIDGLDLRRSDGSPVIAATSLQTTIRKLDVFGHELALDRVDIERPEVELRRLPNGRLEWETADFAVPAQPAAEKPWTWQLAGGRIGGGSMRLLDEAVSPAFRASLSNVTLDAQQLASTAGRPGHIALAFDSDDGAHFGGTADLDAAALAARGHLALTKFSLTRLFPYYAQALALDVRRGTLELTGDFDVTAAGAVPQVKLAASAITVANLDLAVHGERDLLWRIPQAVLSGVGFDLARRSVTIGTLESRQASALVVRDVDGTLNFARLVRITPQRGATNPPLAANETSWRLAVDNVALERFAVNFEDRATDPPVKLAVSDLRLAGRNFGNARDAKGTLDLRARVGAAGRIAVAGPFSMNPATATWRVETRGVELAPLRPYFERRTNVIVTGGVMSARGALAFAVQDAGPLRATYQGDVTVTDFASLDRPTAQDLVRWKTLALAGVNAATEPFKLDIASIGFDDFYARLIVNPDATLNLQKLLAPESAGANAETPTAAAPAPVSAAIASTPAVETSAPTASAATSTAAPSTTDRTSAAAEALPVTIGRIQFEHGNVEFSDLFIKPNYSANLTDVSGSVSSLSATQAGDVMLDAKLGRTAPVEIRGTVNPFAPELVLDLTGKARDIDLPPLTPYAEKYAGYGIKEGKLAFDVHYKVEKRKLAANNKLVLDQLTFGERVESPTATKLPVLLAVALLKDRNGVIDVELPISGSLDDPQFSVGGLIIRVIMNLITKSVTAPFALLGALAGGGEQLAFIEFPPGQAVPTPAAEIKLKSLAKALADRPGLKLDAAGRVDPGVDRDGLKRATLDRAVRAQKQKTLAAQGASASSADAGIVNAADYPRLLAAVYKNADIPTKPRNALGFAKEIPPAEMEALLLANYPADDDALRELANHRAEAAKDWLAQRGGIAPERLFLAAPHLSAEGVKDGGAPSRVDFSLK